MSDWVLTVYPKELPAGLVAGLGPSPTGAEIAAVVRRHLAERQPWIAERVEVRAADGHASVAPRRPAAGTSSSAERPLQLLRSVEGALGMTDKLSEVLDDDGAKLIDVDLKEFALPPVPPDAGPADNSVLLQSKVRCFPLPQAEWFEIYDGLLSLTHEGIAFRASWRPEDEDQPGARTHAVPLQEIVTVRRDNWICVPCLRVDTQAGSYRYGWPRRREEVESVFVVSEWVARLRSLVPRARQS